MKVVRLRAGFLGAVRQLTALTVSLALAAWMQPSLQAQAPYEPLDAEQLNQLVAPIALYPDSLVAQILTASTYPLQVSEANAWSRANQGLPPGQRAVLANGLPWDPSVKALTAFPSVLDNLARNNAWTSALGNAYYNQPGDVMNAVQSMRYQAERTGALVSTPQQRVYSENGEILIAPVNPAVVYVPYYNPWRFWGPAVVAYPGYYFAPPPPGIVVGVGLGFGVGIGVGVFASYGWGWHAWEPSWHGGTVIYNHNTYISNSTTVINRGNFGSYNRGVYEHEGRGVPAGFHAPVTREGFSAAARRGPGPGENRGGAMARPGGGERQSGFTNAPHATPANRGGGPGGNPPAVPHATGGAPHPTGGAPHEMGTAPHAQGGHPPYQGGGNPAGHGGGNPPPPHQQPTPHETQGGHAPQQHGQSRGEERGQGHGEERR